MAELSHSLLEARGGEPNINANRGPLIIGTAVLFIVVICTSTWSRFWTRRMKKQGYHADDYFVIVATVSAIAMSFILALSTKWGYGRYSKYLSKDTLLHFRKTSFSYKIFYLISLAFSKLAVLTFYLRIFTVRKYQWIIWIAIILVIPWSIQRFLSNFYSCKPFARTFDPSIKGKCDSSKAGLYLSAISNVWQDLVILLVPIPMLVNLKMSRRRKLALYGMFALGGLTTVVSIVRFAYVFIPEPKYDFTYDAVKLVTLGQLETVSCIICANLLVTVPLFKEIWVKLGGSLRSHRSSSYAQSGPRFSGHGATSASKELRQWRSLQSKSDTDDTDLAPLADTSTTNCTAESDHSGKGGHHDEEMGTAPTVPSNAITVQRDLEWKSSHYPT